MPGCDAGGFVRHLERLPADSACPTPSSAAPGGAASAAVSRISSRRRRHPAGAGGRVTGDCRARGAMLQSRPPRSGRTSSRVKSKTAHGAEMRHLEAPKPESVAELLRSAGSDTEIYHAMGAWQQSDPESMAAFVYSFEWHPDTAKCLGISSSAYTLLFCREHSYFGHIKNIEARIQRPKAEKGRLKIPQLVWMPLARRWQRDCRLLRASLYDGSVLRKKPVQWTRSCYEPQRPGSFARTCRRNSDTSSPKARCFRQEAAITG